MLYTHLSWFFATSSLFFFFFFLTIISVFSSSVYLSLNLFFLSGSPLCVSVFLDYIALTFVSVILLISSIIIIYSVNYINPYSNSGYFIWLTFLFVVSIVLVVLMSNLFFIMLGWDGLGLVSFFLIVYYQNQSSISSGLFTLLINRIGDCLFLLSIALSFLCSSSLGSWFVPSSTPTILSVLLCLTFITNSAIFPFSPWLPLAIAAPTPISSLVHSSTLVTSGLYLMMRYSPFILVSNNVACVLLVASLFTSFYAGLNSIFERDLKNLIALSTLSHLGFIGISYSCGLISLAYFHLLSHALFKSLLFMSMGDTIISLSHMQEMRFLSSGSVLVPSSSSTMLVSLFNLIGLPSLSGFFSNDLVLETLSFSGVSSFLIFIVYINVVFTFFYTIQLLCFMFQPSNSTPFYLVHKFLNLHSILLFVLALISITFGVVFLSIISNSVAFLALSFPVNAAPTLILVVIISSTFLLSRQFTFYSPLSSFYFSSMINLLHLCIPLASYASYTLSTTSLNLVETGALSNLINSNFSSQALFLSRSLLSVTNSAPLFFSLLAFVLSLLFV